ncbi:MAG: DDE-type integrase/transposase/recombinase [Bryobacteraceae bacterium]|nr:DDE-type integrase/transposase/recombinase [Bryobacteraceae bacterium]
MNRLNTARRAQILAALVEGNSIRAISRMTGVSKNTVQKLLIEAGAACAAYQDEALQNLPCRKIQCDEIWSFCYSKDRNLPEDKRGVFGYGSVWTWTAIDADTKLICSWMVGNRDATAAREFIQDLAKRLANRVQLTTDGYKAYLDAIDEAFGVNIDYAMLVKLYGGPEAGEETRYSPAQCVGTRTDIIAGQPDVKYVSTSYVERQNLTMRMHMRRFTRLTNGFSKKIENHIAAISLHFMYYNFVRIHQSLRITPAMAAGVARKVWEIGDIVRLVEEAEKRRKAELDEQKYATKGPALGF